MAEDKELKDLTEETSPDTLDLIYLSKGATDDPRKIQLSNLFSGISPLMGGMDGVATDTTSGLAQVNVFDADVTASPDSAGSQALVVGLRGRVRTGNANSVTGAGHNIGVLGQAEFDQTGYNHPLIIGVEGIAKNTSTGTISDARCVQAHINDNNGTITNAYGFNSQVTENDGTITIFQAYDADVALGSATGTITNYWGHVVSNLAEGSGDIANIVGFLFADQSSNGATCIAFLNQDPDATIDTAGDIVFSLASGGNITMTPTDSASNHSLTLPAVTDTVAVRSDLVTVKTGTFVKNVGDSVTSQAITGVGGKPIALWVNMSNTVSVVEASYGFTDGTNDYCNMQNAGFTYHYPHLVYFNHASAGTDLRYAVLSSFDSDGFTLTWSKTGSPPSETVTCSYIALIGRE